jgi:hypothetical protein
MPNIQIYEQEVKNANKNTVGKVAILRGGLGADNPKEIMDNAVSTYVGEKPYNEFIEIFLDNPWVRIIVSGINELNYQEFKDQKL